MSRVRDLRAAVPAAAFVLLGAVPASAADLPGYFNGGANAAAADASVGPLAAQLTHLAGQGCPCAGSGGKILRSRVGPVAIPGLLSTAATKSQSVSDRGQSESKAQQRAVVDRLSLLGGLITANSIRAQASVDATSSALNTSSSGSHLLALRIAGQKIPDNTPPNTQVPVPNLGTATVYEVTNSGDGQNTTGIQVHMIDLAIQQQNQFGFPVGAHITVANASAGYNRAAIDKVVSGEAYLATVNTDLINLLPDFGNIGGVAISSCEGTDGKTLKNTYAGISEGGITIGAGTTTAYGTTGSNGGRAVAQTTAQLSNINLLAGLITANAVNVDAEETTKGTSVHRSGSTVFDNLVVAGIPVGENVPPNTQIQLPLLGYIVLNEQYKGDPKINLPLTVNALHLFVTTAGLGLPAGAELILGHASALARPLD